MGKAKTKGSARIEAARIAPVKATVIRARIDAGLKAQAEVILGRMGLTASDAIRMFYARISLMDGLPFPADEPNAETVQSLRDAEAGKLTDYANEDEMFEKLGL